MKAVCNEEVIAALLTHATVKEAAAAAGTTPRSIYSRMKEADFVAQYREARAELLREATFTINSYLTAAIQTIAQIMQDEETTPATRLQAAQSILQHAEKFTTRLTIEERQEREQDFDIFNFNIG